MVTASPSRGTEREPHPQTLYTCSQVSQQQIQPVAVLLVRQLRPRNHENKGSLGNIIPSPTKTKYWTLHYLSGVIPIHYIMTEVPLQEKGKQEVRSQYVNSAIFTTFLERMTTSWDSRISGFITHMCKTLLRMYQKQIYARYGGIYL